MNIFEIISLIGLMIGIGLLLLAYLDMDKELGIFGIFAIFISISIATASADINNKEFKPQYKIDLIFKDSVKIYNGEIIKIIHLNEIEEYIEKDTINL